MKVLIAGANGYFGSIMTSELLAYTECDITLAGRNQERLKNAQRNYASNGKRISIQPLSLDDPGSIQAALVGIDIAVCAAGPFQSLPHLFLEQCIDRGIHYIDIADDRSFVMRAIAIANNLNPASVICSGWSTVPALSAVLVELVRDRFQRLDTIRIQIAPGNRSPRAPATVASLLSSLGSRFDVFQDGTWNSVLGWSCRRRFRFPSPVGSRPGYLVDVPDLAIFPSQFGARTVEFRAGAEIDIFNHALAALAWMSSRGLVKSWLSYQQHLQRAMSLFGFLGTATGALGVEVTGLTDAGSKSVRISLLADSSGQNMPVMPAVIMVSQIVSGRAPPPGLVPYNSWLSRSQLENECTRRNYRLVIEEVE